MILLLGGTEDSRHIAQVIAEQGYQVIVSVVTEYGRELVQASGAASVISGALGSSELAEVIEQNKVTTVIDATHPFATQITNLAFNLCQTRQINYVRYERSATAQISDKFLKTATTFEEGIKLAAELPGPWFFTTGSKQLDLVIRANLFPMEKLYVRVLPDPQVLASCYQLGLRAKNIIAMQGPISYELNRATYQDLEIRTVVTKDSGAIGGTPDKIRAGLDMNLNVIMIKRPQPLLPKNMVVTTPEQLIKILKGALGK